jgi:hypothetical protein
MSRSVADVFREAGKRHVAAGAKQLAAFIEKLPTNEDYRRFMDAARGFLSFDMKTRNLLPERRRTVLSAEGRKLAVALWEAAERLLKEDPPSEKQSSGSDLRLFGTRLLMAKLIVRGLQGASDKRVLFEAALQLRELGAYAQATRSKSEATNARREALADSSAQRGQRVARLKTEAGKLRNSHLRKSDRARRLNRSMGPEAWPTADALIAFARRNAIKI